MDRARYKLDRQRVSYLGICTHLADARCRADILRSYNRRISSMEDVIIIGGGPVGFINALGLAQAGVRVSVIEAEPHIINSPRAAVYFWSVLGGLGRLGMLEYHANGGGRRLEEALAGLRRLATDPDFLLQRLMFTKSLETPLLLGASRPGFAA